MDNGRNADEDKLGFMVAGLCSRAAEASTDLARNAVQTLDLMRRAVVEVTQSSAEILAASRERAQGNPDVAEGRRLAEDAGKTMDEMRASLKILRDLIPGSAAAPREPLGHVEEVGREPASQRLRPG